MKDSDLEKNLKKYLFEIWYLRTKIKSSEKKDKREISNKKNKNISLMESSFLQKQEDEGLKKGSFEYFGFTTGGLIGLMEFLREAINNIIFELFVRSINHANQRKL